MTGPELARLSRFHQQWIDTGGERGTDARIELNRLGLNGPDRDIIVLATPEMAELSNWIIAFVAAGGLAAALSTASGLLLVISSSVAHDLYYKILRPNATERQRLLVGRGTIGIAVVIAGLFGIYPPGFVGQVVAFAFGFAAASFFPVILLGIFWKRVGTVPALCGMVSGIGVTATYVVGVVFFGMEKWTLGLTPQGIDPQGIGTFGMAVNLAVTVGLTPFFPPPSAKVQALVDQVREPEGWSPPINIDESAEH